MADNADAGGSTIGEMLDVSLDDEESGNSLQFDFGPDSDEVYREHDGEVRTPAFDILWDHLGVYPPTYLDDNDDAVVSALLDDTDHRYHIVYDDGDNREVGAMGIALMAYLDPEATVGVDVAGGDDHGGGQ